MTQLRGEIAAELREMHRRELNNFSLQCLNEEFLAGVQTHRAFLDVICLILFGQHKNDDPDGPVSLAANFM